MLRRMLVTWIVAGGLSASWAPADQLILHDRTILRGLVERQDDSYRLVGSNGTAVEIPAERVKRYVFESRVTVEQAAAMLEELLVLAGPALTALEPTPHAWLREQGLQSRTDAAEGQYDQAGFGADLRLGAGGSGLNLGGYAQGQSAMDRSSSTTSWQQDTVRRREFDAVFLDEWVRYTALFESLERNPRYRSLVDARRGSGSLREFARYAPAEHQIAADVLAAALEALEHSIELAADSQQRLGGIPLQQLEAERDLLELEDEASRERQRVWTACDRRSQERRAQRAEHRVREQRTEMQSDLLTLTRAVERRIQLFAQEREVARGHLQTAARVLGIEAGSAP